jgi:hypothetical protein
VKLTLVRVGETTLLDHLVLVLDEELDSLNGGSSGLGDSGGDTTLFKQRSGRQVGSVNSFGESAGRKFEKTKKKKKRWKDNVRARKRVDNPFRQSREFGKWEWKWWEMAGGKRENTTTTPTHHHEVDGEGPQVLWLLVGNLGHFGDLDRNLSFFWCLGVRYYVLKRE